MRLVASIVVCGLTSTAAFAGYSAEFGKHWKNAKELTVAVADAMPAEGYDSKPNAEEMGFGELMAHIAAGNYGYCSAMNRSKSPFTKPEKYEKAAVMKLVGDSFDYCSEIIGALSDEQLNAMIGPENRQSSVRELTEAALMHMAHHRGQAEVYLRVKGIKPPTYKF